MANKTPQLNADTLSGDIRDWLLTWVRSMKKPYEQMSESDQRDIVDAAAASARELIGKAITVVSGRGFERAFVKLGQFTVKDGIEAKVVTDRSERNLLNFNDFAGRSAVLIFADPSDFDGQRAPAKIFKPQIDIEEAIADAKAADPPATTSNPDEVPSMTPKEVKAGDVLDVKVVSTAMPAFALSAGAAGVAREKVNPETGEITEDWTKLEASDTRTVDPPEIKGDLKDPATGKTLKAKVKPTAEELPDIPKVLDKRKKKPAPPGALGPDDPGEPTEVTVDDSRPVANETSLRDPFDEAPQE